jgi:hypothetical protein
LTRFIAELLDLDWPDRAGTASDLNTDERLTPPSRLLPPHCCITDD